MYGTPSDARTSGTFWRRDVGLRLLDLGLLRFSQIDDAHAFADAIDAAVEELHVARDTIRILRAQRGW